MFRPRYIEREKLLQDMALLSETFDMRVQVDWMNDRPWIRVP